MPLGTRSQKVLSRPCSQERLWNNWKKLSWLLGHYLSFLFRAKRLSCLTCPAQLNWLQASSLPGPALAGQCDSQMVRDGQSSWCVVCLVQLTLKLFTSQHLNLKFGVLMFAEDCVCIFSRYYSYVYVLLKLSSFFITTCCPAIFYIVSLSKT